MPRFFLHLYDDVVSTDDEGVDCPGIDEARDCAIKSARAMACQEVLDGHLNLRHRIEVADEEGRVVDTVYFSDVVRLDG